MKFDLPPGTCLGQGLAITDTWVHSDGPKLFVAESSSGKYLGALAEQVGSIETYLFAATTDHRVANLLSGEVSLRTGFVFPSRGARPLNWAALLRRITFEPQFSPTITVQRVPVCDIADRWLPRWEDLLGAA